MASKLIFEKTLFTPKECELIISLNKINSQSWKNNDRDYKSSSIILNNNTDWIFQKLKTFFEDATGNKIIKLKEEIHFHIFNTDDWFGIHNDSRDSRLFSVGVLLNNNFSGGDFKLYNPNEIVLNKTIGNSYVFDANISHQVTPIETGTRYSLIWFIQNNNIRTVPTKLM